MSGIVVIGAGQAGASLVAKLRSSSFEGAITLIGEEAAPPYQRPPLSKAYLLGEMDRERLFLRPESYYSDQGIDLRVGQRVTEVDADAKTVTLGENTLGYDHLVFTTGARPRPLPAGIGGNLDGVLTVRDLADADRMAPYIEKGGHVLVVGGGYIGLEAAAVARKKGLEVTLIETADRILKRVACAETSAFFHAVHTDRGVRILTGMGLARLEGADHVAKAVFANGETLEIDLAIVGIGVTPNSELAEQAGVTCQNGIRTNIFGETSVAGIWAAGDCASVNWNGTELRIESVQNAIDQAENVALNILGNQVPYEPKPWFWSDQYDVKLQIAGLNHGYTDVVTRKADGTTSHWYYAGDSLISVDAMNDPRGYMVGKRLIEAGKSPAPSAVKDPETDLKSLLRG